MQIVPNILYFFLRRQVFSHQIPTTSCCKPFILSVKNFYFFSGVGLFWRAGACRLAVFNHERHEKYEKYENFRCLATATLNIRVKQNRK
jgi:hypothetical protein